ncbi:NADH-quinone oxidoreductase subunit C [candidate division KSB1 bacterium]
MKAEEFVNVIEGKFSPHVKGAAANYKRAYIKVEKIYLRKVVEFMVKNIEGTRFSIATGIDTRNGIEVIYHFSFNGLPLVANLKVVAGKPFPEIETLGDIFPGTLWIEREIHDLLGVKFINHPNLKRLVKAEMIPEDVYPLRRDFNVDEFKRRYLDK